jgi:hypothetical protein
MLFDEETDQRLTILLTLGGLGQINQKAFATESKVMKTNSTTCRIHLEVSTAKTIG